MIAPTEIPGALMDITLPVIAFLFWAIWATGIFTEERWALVARDGI